MSCLRAQTDCRWAASRHAVCRACRKQKWTEHPAAVLNLNTSRACRVSLHRSGSNGHWPTRYRSLIYRSAWIRWRAYTEVTTHIIDAEVQATPDPANGQAIRKSIRVVPNRTLQALRPTTALYDWDSNLSSESHLLSKDTPIAPSKWTSLLSPANQASCHNCSPRSSSLTCGRDTACSLDGLASCLPASVNVCPFQS